MARDVTTVMAAPIEQNKDDEICEAPLDSEQNKDNPITPSSKSQSKEALVPIEQNQTEQVDKTIVQIHNENIVNGVEKPEEPSRKRTRNEMEPESESENSDPVNKQSSRKVAKRKVPKLKVGKTNVAVNKATAPKVTKPNKKVGQSEFEELKNMMISLTGNVSAIQKQLTQVETNVTANVAKIIDVKINEKLSVAKKEIQNLVTTEISKVRNEFERKLKGANDQIKDTLSSINNNAVTNDPSENQKKNNVVIRNLKEHYSETGENGNEKTIHMVNSLIRDGIQLKDIKVTQAERKISRNHKPGVIIATFATFENKQQVMTKKNVLKMTRGYDDIYIENDLTKRELDSQNSLNLLIRQMGKERSLKAYGNRIVTRDSENSQRSAHQKHYHQSERREQTHSDNRGNRYNNRYNQTQRERNYNQTNIRSSDSYSRRHQNSHTERENEEWHTVRQGRYPKTNSSRQHFRNTNN